MKKKRFRPRIKKESSIDVEITSLLDILVILLVFLLKNYNASDLILNPAENLNLATSKSLELGNKTVMIQVNKDKFFWVDEQKIGQIDLKESSITLLREKLEEIKKALEEEVVQLAGRNLASATDIELLQRKKLAQTRINLVFDQDLPYEYIKLVMHTSALSGFPEFKFIVKGKSQ